ncbi:MAG: MotA/TolQ/ExbB proton channel family protein [Nitrospirae bacterium]|nr:MotA/TolQ/ExbB proton channel family protein [Candidatus Manganitrophaceae bacterium]
MEIIDMLTAIARGGGVFIYLILFILVFGTAIVIERTLFIKRSKVNGTALLATVREALQTDHREQALLACRNAKGPLGVVFARGLSEAVSPVRKETVQGAVDEALLEVLPQIEKRVDYLPTLANIANLLGLLGTILGLIKSFQAIAVADPAQKGALLAQGISTAMYATAFGLMVAIPLMFFYTLIQSQTNQLLDHLEEYSYKFVKAVSEQG